MSALQLDDDAERSARLDLHVDAPLSHPVGHVVVRVTVKDQGIGVPIEHQANLFTVSHTNAIMGVDRRIRRERCWASQMAHSHSPIYSVVRIVCHVSQPYMQIDAGKLQSSKGTGLGLSLSRSIVDLHGGSVGFTSEVDVGSSFYFSVPVDVCLLSVGAAAPSIRSGRSSGSVAGASEEDDVFRDLITPPQKKRPLASPRIVIGLETPTSTISASGWHTDSALATQTGTTPLSLPFATTPGGGEAGSSNDPSTGGGGGGVSGSAPVHLSHPSHLRCKTELFFGSSASPSAISPDAFSWHSSGTNMSSSPDAHLAAGMVASSNALPIQNTPPPTNSTIQIIPSASGTAAGQASNAGAAAACSAAAAAVSQSSSAPPLIRAATTAASGRTVSFTVHRQRSVRMIAHDPAAHRGRMPVRHESNPSATPSLAATAASSPMAAAGASASLAAPFLASPAPSASPSPSSASSPGASSGPPHAPPVRVLVVEDSAPNRKLLCALLTRLRCAVTAVENGQLCVDLMRPHFDVPDDAAATGQVNWAAANDKSPPPPVPFDIVLMVRQRHSWLSAAAECPPRRCFS